ncbi:MAG: hypothetical protein JWM80_967 [Cyanobacteria bacterium RYN_339]|nr:hypothetical protein [Cyanobacteria bacterium RYN_339]
MLALAALLAVAPITMDPSDPGGSPRTAVEDRRGLDSTPLTNPWVAFGLALAPSMAASALATANPALSQVATIAIPFGFGLGHFYAGDPLRGLLVTAGGPIATIVGAGLGGALNFAAPGQGSMAWVGMGGMTAATIYGSWAAFDAYETAERQNQRGRPGIAR